MATLALPGDAPLADWLAARREGIGASEVAAVVGLSPYDGPLRVWLSKVAGLDVEDNPAMKWGRRLEDDVLEEFAEQHPDVKVTPKPGMFADADGPWRLCTPDAFGEDEDGQLLIEVKTGMSYGDADAWGEPGTDEIPVQYLCQVTWSCDILGLARWALPVLLLDQRDYREYRGQFDPELAALLRARVGAFWHGNVLAGVEPAADGLASTVDLLADRALREEKTVDLPADAAQWLIGYRVNHQAIAAQEEAKREWGNLLRQHLVQHDATVGLLGGEKVVTFKKGAKGAQLRVKGVTW